MTTKKNTPSGAQRSTSDRTKQPATPSRPKHTAASDKKSGTKGKAAPKLTPEQKAQIEAEAEAFRQAAHDYASKAYTAALAHYEANHRNPFALSRLAVVYEESKPGDFHMVVTLPGSEREKAITDADLHKWLARVEMLCRTLEHPDCSDHFRRAFGAVFTDDILSDGDVSWTTPTVVRVMLPLALMEMTRLADASPQQFLSIFETLRETLNDDATAEEVRASVVGL